MLTNTAEFVRLFFAGFLLTTITILSGVVAHKTYAAMSINPPIENIVVEQVTPISIAPTSPSWTMEVSGYTSTVGQTDDTPCIAADNSDICARKAAGELICASNAFKLGTRIHVDGLGPCVVSDRMNRRYRNNVDWYFGKDNKHHGPKWHRAIGIGRKQRKVTVISEP